MEQTPKPDYWDDLICIQAGCFSGKQQTEEELISRVRHKPKNYSRIFKFECFFLIFAEFLLNFTTVQPHRAISSLSVILHCKELQLKMLLLQCWQKKGHLRHGERRKKLACLSHHQCWLSRQQKEERFSSILSVLSKITVRIGKTARSQSPSTFLSWNENKLKKKI